MKVYNKALEGTFLQYASVVGGRPTSGATIIHDTFTDDDATILDGRKPDIINLLNSAWIKANTYDMEISGNELVYIPAAETAEYKDNDHIIDTTLTALTIEVDVRVSNMDEIIYHSVVIRYIDNLNSTVVQWQSAAGIAHSLQIKEQVDAEGSSDIGGEGGGHTFANTDNLGEKHTMRIVDDGNTITATLLGETVTANSSNHTESTSVGIRTSERPGQAWDNFIVSKT